MSVVEAMSYDRLQFNALPAVDVADENVRANDKLNVALAVLGPIFVQHGFCDAWGISLLHKHWLLEEGESPVQEIVCKDEETVFITRPRASDFAGRFLPSIMKVSSDMRLRVVELSNDPNVRMAHDLLRAAPQFVTAFCRAVVANHLADTFGLIANKATMEGRGLIEFNYTDRMSVLRPSLPADDPGRPFIQTSWRFAKDASGIDCHFNCTARCDREESGHSRGHDEHHTVDT
jgi:hypothetical protein